jgi:L-aminopeptidase/D-esterase-like protein
MHFCEEAGRGVATPAGPVPIVVGAAIFDLGVGEARVRPGAAEGYAACAAAAGEEPLLTGPVGAGTGATVGKAGGDPRRAGLGAATLRDGDLVVAAIAVVNAWGDAYDRDGAAPTAAAPAPFARGNTTLALVVTNARLTKLQCLRVAQAGSSGLARALEPAHSAFDGDAVVAAATGEADADPEHVRVLAARAAEQAVRDPLG